MLAQTLLLSAVLAHLASPGFHLSSGGALPWVTATALGARLHRDLGVVPEAALGFRGGRPMVLAVVPIKLGVGLAATAPGPRPVGKAAKLWRTWEPADFVRAEVRTAQAFWRMAQAAQTGLGRGRITRLQVELQACGLVLDLPARRGQRRCAGWGWPALRRPRFASSSGGTASAIHASR